MKKYQIYDYLDLIYKQYIIPLCIFSIILFKIANKWPISVALLILDVVYRLKKIENNRSYLQKIVDINPFLFYSIGIVGTLSFFILLAAPEKIFDLKLNGFVGVIMSGCPSIVSLCFIRVFSYYVTGSSVKIPNKDGGSNEAIKPES